MKNAISYTISMTNGRKLTGYETYLDAINACYAKWPDAEIGHDGVLDDGGDRTLVWRNEEESVDHAGSRAVAEIFKVHS